MTSAVFFSTGRPDTTDLVFSFAPGMATIPGVSVRMADIQEYKDNGLPIDTDCFVFLGILRGTGLVYRECKRRCINFYYIDHAYFSAGYERGWLRVVKNHHTMSKLQVSDPQRWNMYFANENPIFDWKSKESAGENILVLPPTHAVSWMFDEHSWLDETIAEIRKFSDRPVNIRAKPNEPRVDEHGELIDMILNESNETTLEEDLKNAHCVVAYNSNSTILATRMGLPVIASKYNPCHSISKTFSQLETDSLFDEPPREMLFHWLAYNQFHFEELQNGAAWRMLFDRTDQGN